MTPKIISVKANDDYKLKVKFADGKIRLFNITPFLNKGIFQELKKKAYFKKVGIIPGGIAWPHEQDLSAETLYYKSVKL